MKMAGVAAVAYAAPVPAIDAPVRKLVRSLAAIRFTNGAAQHVGPMFVVPAEWWQFAGGTVSLHPGALSIYWRDNACTIAGLDLVTADRPTELLATVALKQMKHVIPGDIIWLDRLEITL